MKNNCTRTDIGSTFVALDELNLVNEVEVVRDGLEVLDYQYRRGHSPGGRPAIRW